MFRRIIALAGLSLASLAAQATLTTLPPGWPPGGSTGLEGVQFNVVTANDVTVALGAHAYKNGATMPNDTVSVFTGQSGVYLPDGKGYANWSFDFAWNIGNCTGCRVILSVDTDPTAAVTLVSSDVTALGSQYADSWNLEMSFIPFNFDPFASSSTVFLLSVESGPVGDANILAQTGITVNVAGNNVPEPGSLALMGLGLAGLAAMRKRKQA